MRMWYPSSKTPLKSLQCAPRDLPQKLLNVVAEIISQSLLFFFTRFLLPREFTSFRRCISYVMTPLWNNSLLRQILLTSIEQQNCDIFQSFLSTVTLNPFYHGKKNLKERKWKLSSFLARICDLDLAMYFFHWQPGDELLFHYNLFHGHIPWRPLILINVWHIQALYCLCPNVQDPFVVITHNWWLSFSNPSVIFHFLQSSRFSLKWTAM